MRTKDNKLHGFSAPLSHNIHPTLDAAAGSRAETEPNPTPWCGEALEAHGVNWETAWIDLGGEG